MDDPKPFNTLILDSGPIIKNEPPVSTLLAKSNQLLTVPAIISEIRDAATRSRLETTLRPFLTLRDPKPESLKFVQEFARRTGDLQVLSKVDLSILALAYEVECEKNGGDWRLRKVPGQKGLNGSLPKKEVEQSETGGEDEAGTMAAKQIVAEKPATTNEVGASEEQTQLDGPTETKDLAVSKEEASVMERSQMRGSQEADRLPESQDTILSDQQQHKAPLDDTLQQGFPSDSETKSGVQQTPSNGADTDDGLTSTLEPPNRNQSGVAQLVEPIATTRIKDDNSEPISQVPPDHASPFINSPGITDTHEPFSDDDSDGWITPSNLHSQQAADTSLSNSTAISTTSKSTQKSTPPTLQVATLTTDFAMQNVLLLMNLNLLSPSLTRIAHLKTHILRCHSCFLQIKDLSKQFCSRCGKPTLTRVTCSTDMRTGEFKLHLKQNMQWNTRGDRYSIPKPTHGSSNGRRHTGGGKGGWGRELILAEDQKEYVKQTAEGKRERLRDLMDEDFLPGLLSGERRREGGRPKVGAGRNVNSKRR